MIRYRDAKVCNNWLQVRTDDHRIQSDYKYKSELQNPVGKKSVLGITITAKIITDVNIKLIPKQ